MEFFRLLARLDLDSVLWSEDLVGNWPPAILLDSCIPSVEVVFLGPVKGNVDRFFLLGFLKLHVVSWSKRTDVDYAPVREDLVVDEWREAITTKSESDVTTRSGIEKACLCWVDTLKKLRWVTSI